MKLLKLNNGSTLSSQWTNNLTGLVIKPNSKIALQNISMEASNEIDINDTNNTFQIQIVHEDPENIQANIITHPIDIEIPNKVYVGIDELLREMTKQLNFAMDYGIGAFAPPSEALQWKVDKNDTKVIIYFTKTSQRKMTDIKVVNMDPAEIITGGGRGFMKNGGQNNKFDAFVYTKIPISISCFKVGTHIARDGGTNSHWIFGLSSHLFNSLGSELTLDDFDYAIYSRGDGNVYFIGKGINETDLGPELENPRGISIKLSLGKVSFIYAGITSALFDFEYGENYHFCFTAMEISEESELGVVGLQDDPVQPLVWAPAAFLKTLDNGDAVADFPNIYQSYPIGEPDILMIGDDAVLPPNPVNEFRYAYFGNSRLGQILGFDPVIVHQSLVLDGSFNADSNYFQRLYPTSLLVYMPSLKLESYSASSGGRENILAVLPNVDFTSTGEYVYETNSPVFIDIDNAQAQNLDYLMVKVVSGDEQTNSPLHIAESGCTITVLIDG